MRKSEPKKNEWFPELWAASVDGMRANLIPGIVLWIFGLIIVLTYYFVSDARSLFDQIAELKSRFGFAYSGIATALFGGFIPFLYLWWAKMIPPKKVVSWGLFLTLFWAQRGMEVDALYRFQAWLFGDESDWKTVAAKVAFDQFVYSAVWSAPVTAVFYAWKDCDFSCKRLRARLNRRFFFFETPSILLSIWIVWVPATAIVYSLPLSLQIPLFNIVLCFFVLILSVLSSRSAELHRAENE